MITVNLLPEELRPIKRTPLPHLAAIAVLVLAILVMGKVWLGKQGEISEQREIYAKTEATLKSLQHRVDAYTELSKGKERLETMVEVIKEITDNRIIWSERLHQLTNVMPKNIWLKSIKETSKRVTEQRVKLNPETGAPVLDPATRQPVMERVNVNRPVLQVEGYARPSEETQEEVQPYIDALEGNSVFSNQFQMDNPKLAFEEDAQGNRVRTFAFEFTILPKPAEDADSEPEDGGDSDA